MTGKFDSESNMGRLSWLREIEARLSTRLVDNPDDLAAWTKLEGVRAEINQLVDSIPAGSPNPTGGSQANRRDAAGPEGDRFRSDLED